MDAIVECDNCGLPQTFHLRATPCFEEVEHLCSQCFEAEVRPLIEIPIERLLSGLTLRDRSIHEPPKPSSLLPAGWIFDGWKT